MRTSITRLNPCFVILLVLTACLPTPEPLPTALVIPTARPTGTPVPITPTDPPTSTPPPTATPIQTPTLTPTPMQAYEILYQEDRQPMIVASDGSNPRRLELDTTDELLLNSISPDGQWLAYYRGGVIYAYNLATHAPPEPFITAAYVKALRWKPDSLTLFFAIYPRGGKEMGGGVWSLSFTDIDPLNHVNATEAMGDWARFEFSPDGHLAAFCEKPEAGYFCGELYILDIGLRLARRVPLSEECDPFRLEWSPNGARLAVACSSDVGNLRSKFFSVDAHSLEPTQLTPDRWSDVAPVWSPDGTKIAFRTRLETTAIWVMEANDGAKRSTVGTPIIGSGPLVWTPDGDLLAAVRDEPNLAPGLYRISTSTGGAVLLTPGKLTRLMGLRQFQIP